MVRALIITTQKTHPTICNSADFGCLQKKAQKESFIDEKLVDSSGFFVICYFM